MRNRHLYKIEYLHTVGTPESERLKVTALPSPKRLPAAQGFGRRGYAQAGLNLFHPTASPLFQNVGFFIRLRRIPRPWPWRNALMRDIPFQRSIYHASADFAHQWMTHRSLGVGGYGFGGPRACPWGSILRHSHPRGRGARGEVANIRVDNLLLFVLFFKI
jgi:hypothetical protein